MAHRGCVISPDSLCYICGECNVKSQQRNISDYVKKVYFAYFKLILGDQDKAWTPHKVCRRCDEDLRLWFKSKKTAFRFGIPMIWLPHPPPNLDDILSDADDLVIFAPQNESSSDFSVNEGPQLFSQIELNDLLRDLDFSKDAAKL
ncbi:hypothetical protein ACJJTC_001957 [Scirpophaga incertulas]